MTQIEKIYLLDRLHHLIRRKGTGTPKQLANRLKVSERTVYNLIDILRGIGVEINYCKDKLSYCYVEEITLNFLPVHNQEKIKGGEKHFLKTFNNCALKKPNYIKPNLY